MKGQKIRVVIIYILVIIILVLVGYLIYNFFMNDKEETATKDIKQDSDISNECTFDITISEYNAVVNGNNSKLCGGLNKLVINDINLDGTPMDVEVRYYNGNIHENDNSTGMYISGKRAVKLASIGYKNNIGVFDNKLFIFSANEDKPNVVVYDKLAKRVYDLETALSQANVSDPVFTELAKSNNNLDVKVKNSSLNVNSFIFRPTEFFFSTAIKGNCQAGTNIGSNYKVAFSGDNFSAPEFVSFNVCNG